MGSTNMVVIWMMLWSLVLSPAAIQIASAFAPSPLQIKESQQYYFPPTIAVNSQQNCIRSKNEIRLSAWLFGQNDEDNKDETANDFREKSEKEAEMMHRTAKMMEDHRRSQEAAERTAAMMDELASSLVVGKSKAGASGGIALGGGRKGGVKVTYNGQQRPVGCEVDANFLFSSSSESQGIISIEDLNEAITDAMQDGYDQSSKLMGEKIKGLYEQLGLSREPSPLPSEPDGKNK